MTTFSSRKFTALLVLAFAAFAPASFAAVSAADAGKADKTIARENDPVLTAMSAELKRSQSKLRLQEMQRPYYIEYTVTELDEVTSTAAFGALRGEQRQNGRLVRVVVRIGDYKHDSYFGTGEGVLESMPIDSDQLALRHQLWLATDRAYKAALEALSEKEAELKQLMVETPVDDFSKEAPIESIKPLVRIEGDPRVWDETLRATSALFRKDPQIDSSEAYLDFRATNRYLVNSEGSVTRRGNAVYALIFTASTQAADGMELERGHGYSVPKSSELPVAKTVTADAEKILASLKDLRNAPMVEDSYSGPVLFSADAANSVFTRLIAANIAGRRPPLGNPARTAGEFAAHFKGRVLPDFLTVVDDPTVQSFDHKTLMGSYDVDDEGVKAQPLTVIEKGKLVSYLTSRQPIRDFPKSNGRGRTALGGSPQPGISNLFVKSSQKLSFDDLKKKMLDMCKDQGIPYGYFVQTTASDLSPRLLYRVYVSDGHQELVRGASFGQLDTRALRSDLIAAGDEYEMENRSEPVPRSIISPPILFGELEIKRANRAREKLPQYPPPETVNVPVKVAGR